MTAAMSATKAATKAATPLRWLELAPGFACNCRCLGCHSCSADATQQMDSAEVVRWLQQSRQRGAQHLWLSGGEPTLRKDFLPTLRLARQLGYRRIKVQSNGLLFNYPVFADKAVAAGMNEVNLLLKSRDPAVHDHLNQLPGSLDLLDRAVEVLRTRPLRLEGDILWTQQNADELPEIVDYYGARGFRHFNVWLFSLVDQGDADLRGLVPQMTKHIDMLLRARDLAKHHGATLVSLNTPHCVVPPAAWDLQFDAAAMGMLVVNPGGMAFRMEQSAIETGVYAPQCGDCAARPWCHGVRQDYVSLYGVGELRPIAADIVTSHDPRGSALDD